MLLIAKTQLIIPVCWLGEGQPSRIFLADHGSPCINVNQLRLQGKHYSHIPGPAGRLHSATSSLFQIVTLVSVLASGSHCEGDTLGFLSFPLTKVNILRSSLLGVFQLHAANWRGCLNFNSQNNFTFSGNIKSVSLFVFVANCSNPSLIGRTTEPRPG